MKLNVVKETPLSTGELKTFLEKAKKNEELNFRAQKTIEYLEQINALEDKKSKQLQEEITKLNVPRLKENQIIKLTDLHPKTVDEVKTALQGYNITITNENVKKIADVFSEEK